MLERNAILRHLYTAGRMGEEGIITRVDEALLKASKNPMDDIPKKLTLKTKQPAESAQMSTENLLKAFYEEPDDICYFEFGETKEVIDSKIYATMKAILNLGVTPDIEVAEACSNIFKYLIDTRKDYKDSAERLKEMPSKTPCEKEIRDAIGKLWGVS